MNSKGLKGHNFERNHFGNALCHQHRKSVGSIPTEGPIVDLFFPTVPGLKLSCV